MTPIELEAIKAIKPGERWLWITHPNNRALLDAALGPAIEVGGNAWLWNEIKYDENVPERNTVQVWHPPTGDRFVEYEASDEWWMRPRGMGHVETIDLGPAFYRMSINFTRFLSDFAYKAHNSPPLWLSHY